MMKRTLAFLILSAQVALAESQTPSPPSIPNEATIRQMLSTRIDVQKQGTGVVVGIVEQGGHRIISYGTMRAGEKRSIDGDTVFGIGSITKVFTALLLADMVQRGEMALDDPAAKYLPAKDVTLPTSGSRQITLADLATHTAGLPLRPANLVSKNRDNPYAGYTIPMLYQFLSSFHPSREIGSQYEYSNVGYGLLGEILSRHARQNYSDLVRARITGPLAMIDTRIVPSASMKSRVATGYNMELVPVRGWELEGLEGAGAFSSTANDLVRFLEALLGYRKSELLPAMRAMTTTRRPGGMEPSQEIALAWNVFADKGREVIWKNGSVGGCRSFIGYDPGTRRGAVALINAQTAVGADDIGLHLLDPNFPVDMHTPRVHKVIKLGDPAILERFVGRYQFAPNDIIIITHEGDRLFAQQPGQEKLELFPESERDFFLKVVDAQVTFELKGDGPSPAAIWHQRGQDQRGERMQELK
jgi:CubicO group peptidase (beta-lactamase class C family)